MTILLDQQRAIHPLNTTQLTDLVRDIADNDDLWRHRLEYHPFRRWWTRLHTDKVVDVWLLTWLTDQGTELHDHGESSAVFTVVSGELSEVRPQVSGGVSKTTLGTGDISWIPPGAVHDVNNVAPNPAVSIHAYSPPLGEMSFYEQQRGRLVRTRTELTIDGERESQVFGGDL